MAGDKRLKNREYEQDRGVEAEVVKKPKAGKLDKIPPVVKSLFVKFWFAGLIFYFLGMGLSLVSADQLDMIFALGLTLGAVTDLAVNRILLALDSDSRKMRKHILCYSKKFLSLPVNLVYCLALAFLIAGTYIVINLAVIKAAGLPADKVPLAAEPILYGVFFVAFDAAFVGIKRGIAALIKKIRNKGEAEVV